MLKGITSRRLALEVLIQVEKNGAFVNSALADALERKQLAVRDRAFVTALVLGVIRQRSALDAVIATHASKGVKKLPIPLLNVLRLGVFQLQDMPDIPPSAVLNTCGELAKIVGHVGQVRFTNGLLRGYLRSKTDPVEASGIRNCRLEASESTFKHSEGFILRPPRAPLRSPTGRLLAALGSLSLLALPKPRFQRTLTERSLRDTIERRGGLHPPAKAGNESLSDADNLQDVEKLSATYSMPIWLVDRWLKNFGGLETIKLLGRAQQPSPLTLRACTRSITVDELESMLKQDGLNVRRGVLVPTCLIIESKSTKKGFKGAPKNISGYKDGLFSLQDEASAFVSIVVDPQPGETVVDLCAAPGSKTMHLAELMNNYGQVIAIDQNEKQLDQIKINRSRLGLTNIQLLIADGRSVSLAKQADRVLLDAPCMGTGVLSKRPDVRYHRAASNIGELVTLQRELLNNAASLVKPGGVLVYSTCSIEPEENIENMQWFLTNYQEFQGSDLTPYIPSVTLEKWSALEQPQLTGAMIRQNAINGFIQLLPSRHDVSGFFVCRMVKQGQ